MLADSKRIQSHLVGEFDLLDQLAQAICGIDGQARVIVGSGKAVDPYLHGDIPLSGNGSFPAIRRWRAAPAGGEGPGLPVRLTRLPRARAT
jgi:hypothetical protein